MTDARKLLVAMTLAAALVGSTRAARGEEGDAESRFHQAYEAEVVDGKLAESAKVYLALLGDEKAPPRIRAEAKYRFAVTTVLLGRSDEARAHLDDLVRDAATPEPVRARAKASLEAVSGVGLGTELDRKLQSLVFDLGRDGGNLESPPVYRDFEILGKQAVPMLRQLLSHQDAALRVHAFRLLMRLDEPGMMNVWSYDFPQAGAQALRWADLRRYLERHPEQRETLEQAALALDDDKLRVVLQYCSWAPSAAFLRAARARGVDVEILVGPAGRAWKDPEVEKLRWEWVCDPDPAVARAAAQTVLTSSAHKVKSGDPEATRYLAGVVNAYATASAEFPDPRNNPNQKRSAEVGGLLALANACPVPVVIEQIDRLVRAAVASPKSPGSNLPTEAAWWPLRSGFVGVLATSVEDRSPSGDDLLRFADIVLAWADLAVERGWASRQSWEGGCLTRVRFALGALPRERGIEAARRIFGKSDPRVPEDWVEALPAQTADHFAVALAAFRVAPYEVAERILQTQGMAMPEERRVSPDPGHARAALAAFPEIVRQQIAAKENCFLPVAMFLVRAKEVPAEEAQAALVETSKALAGYRNQGNRAPYLARLLSGPRSDRDEIGEFWGAVVLPVAEEVLRSVHPADRGVVLERCLWLLTESGSEPDRAKLADFVAAHAEDVKRGDLLAKALDVLPPERWITRVSPDLIAKVFSQPSEEHRAGVESVLARIAPTPADATASVRAYVSSCATWEVQRTFFDRVLREAPVAVVSEFAIHASAWPGVLGNTPVSPTAIEDAVVRLTTTHEPLHLRALGILVAAAVLRQPSERLFPAIRTLLASQDKTEVLSGINAAAGLGRAELLDSLADKLDSMDAGVREAARKAIDAIVELRGLRDEARKRAAETKSKPR